MSTSLDGPTVLYWFSGSGNSLAAAKALAGALREARLVSLTQALRQPVPPACSVGVVFPVHAFGLPDVVARFLREVPLGPDPYVFTVATAAGVAGATHHQAAGLLNQRGVALAAGWTLRMPENFSPVDIHLALHGVPWLVHRAGERVSAIAQGVQAGIRGVREDSVAPLAWAAQRVHRAARPFLAGADRRFVVSEHCSGCGLCAAVCPVGNIRTDGGRPTWGGHCESCSACLQWCPVGAIRMKGIVANRRRYHHPEVCAEDIAAQSAVEA